MKPFLEQLQSHKGGLIRLKTQLYWYGGGGWDDTPDRVCLLLDADALAAAGVPTATTATAAAEDDVSTLLLFDGKTHWVWVSEQAVEIVDESR